MSNLLNIDQIEKITSEDITVNSELQVGSNATLIQKIYCFNFTFTIASNSNSPQVKTVTLPIALLNNNYRVFVNTWNNTTTEIFFSHTHTLTTTDFKLNLYSFTLNNNKFASSPNINYTCNVLVIQ